MDLKHSDNYLLTLLDQETQTLLRPTFQRVSLRRGDVLHRGGEAIAFIYFPISCILSVLATTEEGQTAETSIVGRDGMIGSSVAHGIMTSFAEIIVQTEGDAMRMSASDFRHAGQLSENLRNIIVRFDMSLLAQSQQSTVCQATHAVESRAARWLLQCRAKLGTDEIHLTQEVFAQMLGVQRTTVTLAEKTLKRAGLITVGRGKIKIDDAEGLKAVACACFERIEGRYAELLGEYRKS